MKLPRLLRTASFRLAAFYVLVFVGSVTVLGAVVFWNTRRAIEAQLRQRIELEMGYLAGEYARGGLDHLAELVRQRDKGISALDYRLQDHDGTVLGGGLPGGGVRPGWNRVTIPEADERGVEPELILVAPLAHGVTLSVGDDLGRLVAAGRAISHVFGVAILGFLVLGVIGGVFVSRGFLLRVDSISRTAEAIIAGKLHRRVPIHGTGDDLDRLAGTLNRMLDRNEFLMHSLRHLGSNVAHDLRTPLSQLRQTLEQAHREARSTVEFRAALETAIGKAQAMQQIFTALLRIGQIEGGSKAVPLVRLGLADLLETVADAYQPLAEQDGYDLGATSAGGCAVDGDRELLMQLLVNVVENAMQHTPPGTRITLAARERAGAGVELVVADDGPGVPEPERARILERFYRCERSRTTPGHGLGLSLVAAIAELHGASLAIEDAGPGLRLRIAFPPAVPAPAPSRTQAPAPARRAERV